MGDIPENVVWEALSGAQAAFSVGTPEARRYAPGFSPILGFADPDNPRFGAIEPFCAPGEHFYCRGWDGPAPAGWIVEREGRVVQMVWRGGLPPGDADPALVALGPSHAAQALDLATRTQPGPFGPRTLELGDYFGIFEGTALVAMAGERMRTAGMREISGVCTEPGFQGRGLARRLMLRLIRRELLRGETPFLHVVGDNARALGLYGRMGFIVVREFGLRVLARL